MNDGKLTTGTLTPAYGRDYASGPAAIADFESGGKDFMLQTFNGSGLVSRQDFVTGARVMFRYAKLRKVASHIVGTAPKTPRPRKAKPGPTSEAKPANVPTSYRVDVFADDTGMPTGNRLRFASHLEAETYARTLAARWFLVRSWIVCESFDDVNARLEGVEVRSV